MKQVLFQITGFLGGIFFLAACGGTTSDTTVVNVDSSNAESVMADTSTDFVTIENELEPVEEEEELLAENFDDPKTETSDEFIKTELNDVVLSRKTPKINKDLLLNTNQEDDSGYGSGDGPGDDVNGPAKREIISKPEIKNPTQEEGTVSVELTIDKEGKVINATVLHYGAKTTTSNESLIKAAHQYALQYRFNSVNDGPETAKQIIHIRFTL